ncbi:nicotinate-nucleotide--dimethylbenzimidazole phosphoribosyltransferase [Phytoactinopolyspora halophila]|uniref:nicotinate-nucleotide--dimethylbenzimidazole phosphoribosyltransferase n=1 Tax=Phytoactinopolyspora halophila TaxID=1981511 RepID=UPI001B8D6ED1|nr:nicotinate-nucleotide--dimethylbenzimidazole phosphoribosyltransferase [Phytoactinopolyspora halophila]
MEKIVVLGGARSGKSRFAENWVRELDKPGHVVYVATAGPRPGDEEWAERVRRHQERRPASWLTRETSDVASVLREATGTVIVECLALWLTAVLDAAGAWNDDGGGHREGDGGDGAGASETAMAQVDAAIDELVQAWRTSSARVVAVSNEVGWGIVPETRAGRLFRDLLGTLNQRLSAEADRVVLCVAGRTLDLGPETASTPARHEPPESHSEVAGQARRGVPAPVDRDSGDQARELIDGLAKPVGSLGRLEEIGVWLAGRQGAPAPRYPSRTGVTVIAGDHGIAADASAYPASVTAAMVRTVATGQAAINALASEHGATVRVRDLGVASDLSDLSTSVTEHKIRSGTGRIDSEDAMTSDQAQAAIEAGRVMMREELTCSPPADMLVAGDLGIGNTTIAAALTGAILGLDAEKVTGRGTGVDDPTLWRKTEIVAAAIDRAHAVRSDPAALLATIGGPDLAAMAGFLAETAEQGVPAILDGVVVTAAALVADLLTPGASTWWLAGHRSVEPAHTASLDHLGLEPVVELHMRLGEGTGALAALPIVRSAVAVCTRMASLADLNVS